MPIMKKFGFAAKKPSPALATLPPPEISNYVCEFMGMAEDMIVLACHERGQLPPTGARGGAGKGCVLIITQRGIKAPNTPECERAISFVESLKLQDFTFKTEFIEELKEG